jgi:hypothetical protein
MSERNASLWSFAAKVTATTTVDGKPVFTWNEQQRNPVTNVWEDVAGGRWGDPDSNPAHERNDAACADGTVVEMAFMAALGPADAYVFDAPGGGAPSAGGWTVSVVALPGDTNDLDLGSENTNVVYRIVPSAPLNITGIVAVEQRLIAVSNVDTSGRIITLKHQDTGSALANRFYLSGQRDRDLYPGAGVFLVYDHFSYVWRDLQEFIPDASATVRGLVNTTTQEFAGNKTFLGEVIFEEDVFIFPSASGPSELFFRVVGGADVLIVQADAGGGYISSLGLLTLSSTTSLSLIGNTGVDLKPETGDLRIWNSSTSTFNNGATANVTGGVLTLTVVHGLVTAVTGGGGTGTIDGGTW